MTPRLYLNAGAMIDPVILYDELQHISGTELYIHPHAAVIRAKHYDARASLDRIASTQKGTGPALADKIMREKFSVAENVHDLEGFTLSRGDFLATGVIFLSTAQGMSLGINSGFFPFTTCRECTVQQALSDARMPARSLRKVIATFRTFPIRVGNTALGSSGGWYPDQQEISWKDLGVPPETTTVTGRQRRIATWSMRQFHECLAVNDPDALFINFLNYLKTPFEAAKFVTDLVNRYKQHMKRDPDFVMLGFGPKSTDVETAFHLDDVSHLINLRMAGVDLRAAEKAGY
jgi:adenylosuccinate synthase